MTKNNKIRAVYDNLFQHLVSSTKGYHRKNNFLGQIKEYVNSLMLPITLADVNVGLSIKTKTTGRKKAATKATTKVASKAKAKTKRK